MNRQPSVMKHQFSQVPKAEIPRSSFDRSHGVKTTFDSGYLIPFFVDEVLPGDTFNLRTAGFARLATPIYPVMDNIFLDTFYFAVPLRLVWDNFVKMMGEQTNPGDSTDYTIPVISNLTATEGSIYDYMGIPTGVNLNSYSRPSALFLRAYNLIWNEWFRDENLQDSVTVNTGDGPDTAATYTLLRRGKRHDYFTSALPWPQKGVEATSPISGFAPVVGIGKQTGMYPTASQSVYTADGQTTVLPLSVRIDDATAEHYVFLEGDHATTGHPMIRADMAGDVSGYEPASIAINDLREAFQIQRLFERDARGGTRYIELVKSHFGVTSPDARLQRPEYLGGGSTPINITPIAQTSESSTTPQGTLSAIGTASFTGHGFTKSFVEHSIIIGLVCARADLTYQQGMNKMFLRRDRFDFYWPALAHLGEQAISNNEIYTQGTIDDWDVFGYQERYAEYRYKPSTIHGAFRSNAAASLDAWHLAQDFASLPVLGDTFIQDNPPIDRVIAVPSEPQFIADFYHKLVCARPMPLYGVPGLIDHF